jgi:pterin-4a-carbinolamine dehydratase
VTLQTHDVGGLTADDLALSAAMDGIAAHLPAPGGSS